MDAEGGRNRQIEVRVQLFGILAEHMPEGSRGKGVVRLQAPATVKDLLEQLGINRRVAFAVNGEHDLDESHALSAGDTVLFFTSVSGG